jgi:Concanavalin A-like lectin/glucanases superfamily
MTFDPSLAPAQNTVVITCDHTAISADVYNFPLDIVIDSSVTAWGGLFADLSPVDGEVIKKIAIQASSTQLYVEVEPLYLSGINSIIRLHVKVPTYSYSSDTVLVLTYDSGQGDNDDYVGGIGTTPGQNAWDSNFVAVYHLCQDPSIGGACILDSTVNANNGTPYNMSAGNLVTATYGKGLNFIRASSQYIQIPDSSLLDLSSGGYFIEAVHKPDDSIRSGIISKLQTDSPYYGWNFEHSNAGDGKHYLFANSSSSSWQASSTAMTIGQTYYAATRSGAYYLNSLSDGTNSQTNTPSATTQPVWIGRNYNSNYYDGVIEEIRVSKIQRSTDWITLTYLSITNNLITLPSSVQVLVFLDQSYESSVIIKNYISQIYGLQLTTSLVQTYGQQAVVTAFLTQVYRSNPVVRNKLDQVFKSSDLLTRSLSAEYTLTHDLLRILENEYIISAGPVQNYANQNYDIKAVTEIMKSLNQQYNVFSDGQVITDVVSATVNGQPVAITGADIEYSNSSYTARGSLVLANYDDWDDVDYLQPVVLTINGEDHNLIVTSKSRSETVSSLVLSVECMSPAVLLDFPYATKVADNSPVSGTMSQIVNNLAALEGLSIVWGLPVDDTLTENELQSEGRSPMDVIGSLVGELGGMIQSLPDGSIHAVPRYPIDTNKYDITAPLLVYTSGDDFISIQDDTDKRDGFNKYVVTDSNTEASDPLEAEEITPSHYKIKAYSVPWNSVQPTLTTSELTNVTIVPVSGYVEEELTQEDLEIVNGAGSVDKPCYEVVSYNYKSSTNLGVITIKEDGSVSTTTPGNSLVTITYKTRYWAWDAYDPDIENVQFILE